MFLFTFKSLYDIIKQRKDIMEKDFDLEVILNVIIKIKYKENLNEIYNLYWFLYDDPFIMMDQIVFRDKEVINHLITIHPWLIQIKYKKQNDYDKWMMEQKCIYGDKITISKIGLPLSKNKLLSKK